MDGKILASILSRLAREGTVSRVGRGVYRVDGAGRAVPRLSGLARALEGTLGRTFGEEVVARMELRMSPEPDLAELRGFLVRLARYIGRPAAEDLLRRISTATLGDGEAAFLVRRVLEPA